MTMVKIDRLRRHRAWRTPQRAIGSVPRALLASACGQASSEPYWDATRHLAQRHLALEHNVLPTDSGTLARPRTSDGGPCDLLAESRVLRSARPDDPIARDPPSLRYDR